MGKREGGVMKKSCYKCIRAVKCGKLAKSTLLMKFKGLTNEQISDAYKKLAGDCGKYEESKFRQKAAK